MLKKFVFIGLMAAIVLTLASCGGKGTATDGTGKTNSQAKGITDVCNYFPKELIEQAIDKPIVKVETPFTNDKSCFYYTQWSATFDHTPYGDTPGGTQVVVVYDDKDFATDKAYNETHGSTYTKDPSISMDNFVVRDNTKAVWQVVLILGGDKYIRMHYVHQAITGPELLKIGIKFAEKIQSGK